MTAYEQMTTDDSGEESTSIYMHHVSFIVGVCLLGVTLLLLSMAFMTRSYLAHRHAVSSSSLSAFSLVCLDCRHEALSHENQSLAITIAEGDTHVTVLTTVPNISSENLLLCEQIGEGAFGVVFKGILLTINTHEHRLSSCC